jgi:hypothetical protein
MAKRGVEWRGLMLDPARLTERHEYYMDLLPELAAQGYNTLWWHFSDDEGFAIKMRSHPELASPHAMSRKQVATFVAAAEDVGINVVPELECLGHTLFITRLPQYAHLFNGNAWGHNALCPSHDDTVPLIAGLLAETAELFPSRYLHLGLDEAVIGDCLRCSKRAEGRPSWWLLAEHVRVVHEMVTSLGRRMIMWADSVEHHPSLLEELPRDIVLAHWHYREVPPGVISRSAEAGFDVVGVPAISGQKLLPRVSNFENVDDMRAELATVPSDRCRGMVTCWWEPQRILRDTIPLAIHYAALPTNPADRAAVATDFARSQFGIRRAAVGPALWRLHELAPNDDPLRFLFPDSPLDIHELLKMDVAHITELAAETAALHATLSDAAGVVKKNAESYQAYCLAADILAASWANGLDLHRAASCYGQGTIYADSNRPPRTGGALLRGSPRSARLRGGAQPPHRQGRQRGVGPHPLRARPEEGQLQSPDSPARRPRRPARAPAERRLPRGSAQDRARPVRRISQGRPAAALHRLRTHSAGVAASAGSGADMMTAWRFSPVTRSVAASALKHRASACGALRATAVGVARRASAQLWSAPRRQT